jgi:uncharacterized protein
VTGTGESERRANDVLIERFYTAFDAHDGAAMAACYAPSASFSDPVFPDLEGSEPGAMWRMLTGQSKDLRVELLAHDAEDDRGAAEWRATYTFTRTGRPVVNNVNASFRFADGLIVEHRDDFDLHAWARQALGMTGLLLGWTPMVRNGVRKQARASLDEFIARGPA